MKKLIRIAIIVNCILTATITLAGPFADAEMHEDKANSILFSGNYKGNNPAQAAQQEYAVALVFYKQAATNGNATAMLRLAILYSTGDGGTKSEKLAAQWYGKAALAGNAEAMYFYANVIEQGKGVGKSPDIALQWYKKSAAAGYKAAARAIKTFGDK